MKFQTTAQVNYMECLPQSTGCSADLIHVLAKEHHTVARKQIQFVLFPRTHSFHAVYKERVL
jgi:hypothetical protein